MKEFNETSFAFQIGDRVKVHDYEGFPEAMRNAACAKVAGKEGVITDALWSYAAKCMVYQIHLDGYDRPSKVWFRDGSFDRAEEKEAPTYTYEFTFSDNLVIARLYEVTEDSKVEIGKGHGHVFHDGALGIAQAASYALKRIYHDLEEDE